MLFITLDMVVTTTTAPSLARLLDKENEIEKDEN
jgi:protoporphyrinogen oxidase